MIATLFNRVYMYYFVIKIDYINYQDWIRVNVFFLNKVKVNGFIKLIKLS